MQKPAFLTGFPNVVAIMFGADQMFCCNQTSKCCLRPYGAAWLVCINQTNPPPHRHPSELVLAARRRKRVCVSVVFSPRWDGGRRDVGAEPPITWPEGGT